MLLNPLGFNLGTRGHLGGLGFRGGHGDIRVLERSIQSIFEVARDGCYNVGMVHRSMIVSWKLIELAVGT